MMRRTYLRWGALASFALLQACENVSLPALPANISLPNLAGLFNANSISRASVGDELLVTQALSGERCRVRKVGNGGDLQVEDFVVLCAGWRDPSGWLRRFDADPDLDLTALLDDPALALWQPGSAQCEEAAEIVQSTRGEPIATRACVTSDGWPMLAWAARGKLDDRVGGYVGYGLPQLASLVEPLLAGEATRVAGGSESAIVQQARGQFAGEVVSIDDIMNFRQLVRLGMAHNQSAEFADAARAYERALAIKAKGLGGQDSFNAPLLAALGLNLASEGRDIEAALAFERAAAGIERIAWSDAYPTYLSYRAALERRRGATEEAAGLAAEASERRIALLGANSGGVAASRLQQAGIALDQGQIVEARSWLSQAENGFVRAREPVGQSFVHAARARLELRAGNLAKAREHAVLARDLMIELFGEGRNLAEVALDLGTIEAGLGNRDAALSAFRTSRRAADNARFQQSYLTPADLEPYLALLFEQAADDAAAAPALLAEALAVMQLPRSATIERSLRRMSGRLSADNPQLQDLVTKYEDKQQALTETRTALTQLRLGAPAAATGRSEAELEAEIAQLRTAIADDEAWLQRQHPQYGSLVAPGLVEVADASAMLRPGERFLKVMSTPAATYIVAFDADGGLAGHRSQLDAEAVAGVVASLRRSLTFANGLQPFDMNMAATLYDDLLAPVLEQGPLVEHLVLVTDGALLSLPFELLPTRPGPNGDYANAAWLGRDVAISYVSSLSSFTALRGTVGTSQAPLAFAGIGDPLLGGSGDTRGAVRDAYEACQQGEVYDPVLLNALARLPETADELRNIARLLGAGTGDLQLGDEAREDRVRQRDLGRYRTISFATHGLLPGEIRCRNEPGLVLTPPRSATAADDGLLSASEIVTLDLDADLVVLSACNTAGPDGELGGEALSGLASAFTTAGARRIIASHWDVESIATVSLMEGVFANLAEAGGQGHAFAMQQARQAIMADPDRAHPAFWAPFVLIGDGGASAGS